MDGFSISNAGLVNEKTSADYTVSTEQTMNADNSNTARQVQGLSNNQRVREKEEEENSQNQQQKEQEDKEEVFEDGLVEEKPEEDEYEVEIEDFENPNNEFYVKLNAKDDIIELYDSATERLIETISGKELGELVQRLNMASGIFVNKKV